jgi:hypothetical protein
VGTYDLLSGWDLPPRVCDAGLFHSVYGTRVFRQKAWPMAGRDAICGLIGTRAEELVYLFCVINRPKALMPGERPLVVGKDETGKGEVIKGDRLRELRQIEAANLIEQGTKNRKWLWGLWDTDIGEHVRHAIIATLARNVDRDISGEVQDAAPHAGTSKIGPALPERD